MISFSQKTYNKNFDGEIKSPLETGFCVNFLRYGQNNLIFTKCIYSNPCSLQLYPV